MFFFFITTTIKSSNEQVKLTQTTVWVYQSNCLPRKCSLRSKWELKSNKIINSPDNANVSLSMKDVILQLWVSSNSWLSSLLLYVFFLMIFTFKLEMVTTVQPFFISSKMLFLFLCSYNPLVAFYDTLRMKWGGLFYAGYHTAFLDKHILILESLRRLLVLN